LAEARWGGGDGQLPAIERAALHALNRVLGSTEVGFEPTTFRFTSRMFGVDPDGSRRIDPAHVGGLFGPDGSRRVQEDRLDDHRMIKAHPTEHRMPRRSLSAQEGLDVRSVNRTVGPSLGLDITLIRSGPNRS